MDVMDSNKNIDHNFKIQYFLKSCLLNRYTYKCYIHLSKLLKSNI